MDPMIARTAVGKEPDLPGDERAFHDGAVLAAARQFVTAPWQIVVNGKGRTIYGVAEGLYTDLVALDGTDTSVAWILEVETPTTLASDAAWLRLRRAAETGHHFILLVPSGYGEITERLAVRLGFTFGFVYEYCLAGGEFALAAPRYDGATASA